MLENTPHTAYAKSFTEGKPDPIRYQRYIAYATQFYEQSVNEQHSLDRFTKKLSEWMNDFRLDLHPIKINCRNGIYYIVNGSHRAAFACAIGLERLPIEFTKDDEAWGWPLVVKVVDQIEDVFPFDSWMRSQAI